MPHSAGPLRKNRRFPTSLSHRIDQKLLSYCAAATAAGVSLLALPQPGQAEIVYTPANLKIPPNGSMQLDLNHDGIIDFTIQDQFGTCGYVLHCWDQTLRVSGGAQNGVVNVGKGLVGTYARNFTRGLKIGPSQNFVDSAVMDHCKATQTKSNFSAYFSGSFARAGGYLGLAFTINGQTHYGWARFSNNVNWRCHARIVLTGYAYETLPGVPIPAGEWKSFGASSTEHPRDTLGGLALGNVGREAWRRDQVAVENPNQ